MTVLELTEVIADLTNTAASEVSANLKANAEGDELKPKAEIENYLKGLFGNKFQEVAKTNLGRAKKEVLSEFEKKLTEQFGVESTAKGLDLVQAIVSAKSQEAAQAAGVKLDELKEIDLLKLPTVQNIVRGKLQEKDTQLTELQKQLQQIETDRVNTAKREILQREWLGLNPILAKDETTRQRQIGGFLKTVDLDRFKLVEQNGIRTLQPLNSEGEQLLNPQTFNPISLHDRIREIDLFGFHQQNPNNGSPSPVSAQGGAPNGSSKLPTFQSRNDLMRYVNRNRSKGAEHLEAVIEQFEQQQKQD